MLEVTELRHGVTASSDSFGWLDSVAFLVTVRAFATRLFTHRFRRVFTVFTTVDGSR
jgi:hypothetical protein